MYDLLWVTVPIILVALGTIVWRSRRRTREIRRRNKVLDLAMKARLEGLETEEEPRTSS